MDAAESTLQRIKTTGYAPHILIWTVPNMFYTPCRAPLNNSESLAIFLDRDFDAAQFATNVLENDNSAHTDQRKQRDDTNSSINRCLSSLAEILHAVNNNIKQIVYANHHKLVEGAMHVSKLRESMSLISTSLTRSVFVCIASSKAKMIPGHF